MVMGWTTVESRTGLKRKEDFLFPTAFRLALEPTQSFQ
jgi:hypothetical protein